MIYTSTCMLEISVDESIRHLWLGETFLVVVRLEGIKKDPRNLEKLENKIGSVLPQLREAGRDILNDSIVCRMRATFRAMPNMDPSRYRPASESLIRRCLDKGMFRISPLVDTNNILSVHLRVPLGIYCMDSLNNSTSLGYRIGFANETYSTISGQIKNAEGKLVLADKKGVIGSPVSDSGRAVIKGETDSVMVVAYLPFETTREEAERMAVEIESTFGAIFTPKGLNRQLVV